MAPWPVFIIEENKRKWLALLLLFLNILELCIAAVVATQAGSKAISVTLTLHETEGAVFSTGLLTTSVGLRIIVHVPASAMAFDCIWTDRRQRWVAGMHCWWLLFLSTYGAAAMCVCLVLAHMWDADQTIGSWLPLALDRAAAHAHVRSNVDVMQMSLRCCGDFDFRDWFHRSWDPYRGIVDKEFAAMPVTDVVPFSCCDRFFPGPCIRQPSNSSITTLRHTIYRRGCRTVMRDLLGTSLATLTFLQTVSTIIQMAMLVVARFLQTSITSSQFEQNPTVPSPSWLLNSNFISWSNDYPIMDAESANISSQVPQQDLPLAQSVVTKVLSRLRNDSNESWTKKVKSPQLDSDDQLRRSVRASLVRRAVRGKSIGWNRFEKLVEVHPCSGASVETIGRSY